ncbi:MAG: DUF1992 domain-containing protein [Pseudomonadales bacterium]|nr:DUF1992 domain-containing protein [Pseudomonadales bacterium]
MRIYQLVEERIRQAIERGDFDNLPNKGKPLDLRAWKKTPEHLRMPYSVLKKAGITPPEITIKQEIADLKRKISETRDKDEKLRLTNKLNSLMVTHSIRMERINKRP